MDVAASLRTFELNRTDPVDGSLGTNQDSRIWFGESTRITFRLPGIGAAAFALRADLETCYRLNAPAAPGTPIRMANQLGDIHACIGRKAPSWVG